jgi:hypothetical protein
MSFKGHGKGWGPYSRPTAKASVREDRPGPVRPRKIGPCRAINL